MLLIEVTLPRAFPEKLRALISRHAQACGAGNPVTSCDVHVLVYQAAEPVAS